MTENELLAAVLDLAKVLKWRVAHFRPAKTERGWRTPVSADGAGWPDLLLVRQRVMAVELKSDKGRVTREQADWLIYLHLAGVETHVWRPADWHNGVILETLGAPAVPDPNPGEKR